MTFNKKVSSLLNSHSANSFLKEGLKISNECLSGNGALKYSTSNDSFVDNFAVISHFKAPREYSEVAKDMQLLWSINPLLCLKLALYIRLITRKSVINLKKHLKTLNIQKGAGLKNEGIMRMLWIAINHPKTFKRNIPYFIAAGSYKDIFQMLSLDLQYHGWNDRKLDWNFLYYVISSGLNNPNTSQLVRKYLPTIRTNSKSTTLESQANTLVGRWIAHRMFKNFDKYSAYKCYRHLKSEGIAHSWQQFISKQLYDQINFDKIAGRALSLLVNSKFLKNHELEDKYFNWISNKEVAKYTGYVFELFKPLGRDNHYYHIENYKESTINAQFNKLIETGSVNSGLLVVRDTSASMMDKAIGCNVSSFDIGKSLALYFSYFLKGVFANSFAEFSDDCKLHYWKGSTPVDKYINDECEAYGSTNFQSIIDLFIKL